jgi:hypothetical protein
MLYVGPDKVQAVKTAGWTAQVTAMQQVETSVTANDGWAGLAQACNSLLAEAGSGQVRVLLADALVRYFCFPWNNSLRNGQEETALARFTMDDLYGVREGVEWRIALSSQEHGSDRLAVAVPDGLFHALQGCCDAARTRLTSVQAHFCALAQAYQLNLPAAGWLVAHENGRMTCGSWSADGWQSVQSVRSSATSWPLVTESVKRELLLAGVALTSSSSPVAYVSAPSLPAPSLAAEKSPHISVLPALTRPAMGVSFDGAKALAFAMPLFGLSR